MRVITISKIDGEKPDTKVYPSLPIIGMESILASTFQKTKCGILYPAASNLNLAFSITVSLFKLYPCIRSNIISDIIYKISGISDCGKL